MKWALPSATNDPPKLRDTHPPAAAPGIMAHPALGLESHLPSPSTDIVGLSAGMAFRPSEVPTISNLHKSPLHLLVPLQSFDCCFLFPSSRAALPTSL